MSGVRDMAVAREEQDFRGAPDPARDGVELRARTVGVALALDEEHGRTNGRQYAFDVPGTERGAQPGVGPGAEQPVCVVVVAAEPGPEIGALEQLNASSDAGQRNVLDEDVRRFEDQPCGRRPLTGRVEQRNRGAV